MQNCGGGPLFPLCRLFELVMAPGAEIRSVRRHEAAALAPPKREKRLPQASRGFGFGEFFGTRDQKENIESQVPEYRVAKAISDTYGMTYGGWSRSFSSLLAPAVLISY